MRIKTIWHGYVTGIDTVEYANNDKSRHKKVCMDVKQNRRHNKLVTIDYWSCDSYLLEDV